MAALERQQGKRTAREKMLNRPVLMVELVRDRGDDADLVVVPADRANARRIAKPRSPPVGRDRKSRPQSAAVAEHHGRDGGVGLETDDARAKYPGD